MTSEFISFHYKTVTSQQSQKRPLKFFGGPNPQLIFLSFTLIINKDRQN